MKTLSLVAFALCLAYTCSYAQKTKPAVILGTWELVSASYNGQAETEAPHGILKVYDEAGNYQLISVTVQGTLMRHHGKYALKVIAYIPKRLAKPSTRPW
ncbi:MAG: hypothetical protein INR69_11660 [Mucilaginibacter polytrichastri]|nr:hypothetical protein [Mucilaginibacter polytrichastri]